MKTFLLTLAFLGPTGFNEYHAPTQPVIQEFVAYNWVLSPKEQKQIFENLTIRKPLNERVNWLRNNRSSGNKFDRFGKSMNPWAIY